MRIAIVDDEEKWIREIKKAIRQNCEKDDEITCFRSGVDFLSNNDGYEMVFMDVEVGNENGFDISAEYMKQFPQTILIILTTHTELSRKGYKVNAFRYIDKLHLDEINEAMGSAKKRMIQEKSITVCLGYDENVKIKIGNILYFEARGHKIEVVTRTDRYEILDSISQINEKLRGSGFFQVHRSFIVNLEYVKNDNNKEVYISNGDILNMSRRKYREYKQALFEWKIERGFG